MMPNRRISTNEEIIRIDRPVISRDCLRFFFSSLFPRNDGIEWRRKEEKRAAIVPFYAAAALRIYAQI